MTTHRRGDRNPDDWLDWLLGLLIVAALFTFAGWCLTALAWHQH
ncbi:hypothetical protein GCM10010124_25800 [Pilimelia terevasa]|uniref:Uncharacterized protein n=1 Tax=Pilimelia terevasa TaxID=53372 RepID=A0A8J3FL36_9ACTN|nr:hypothetical protein [Pilimelia terevasa]GGK31887.1 hypothetical protein GCM10010124_25800 [Pilimelia terevasa]